MSCQETAGFLFKHACAEQAETECLECGKAICLRHAKGAPGKEVCVHCARRQLRGRPIPAHPRAPRRGRGRRARDDDDDSEWDDPYFYAQGYYAGYGTYVAGQWGHEHLSADPHDFTEADAEAFQVEEDTDYEQDMGAS